ncbi:hypothetical protein [Pedobacter deserti]|uniref:hypothetical protein n=1 Tax=Pedobacter deserti TaxID=2817382 RepID=UPI002108C69C|nr:hypothetical protein [Pedobacter sp. SYSU D00382]
MDKQKLKIYTCSNVGMDYFLFLTRTVTQAGFDVAPIFLTSEADYRRLGKGKSISKLWLRLQMYVLYPIYLAWKVLFAKKNSIFIVSSNTFFAPYLVHLILKLRPGKLIHLLYDLYPDAIEIAGMIKPGSFISRLVGKIARRNLSGCHATVYLGEFLKKHAEDRWGKAPVSDVIDISTDLQLYAPDFRGDIDNSRIILHYGGQLGYLHDADTLIACIKYVLGSSIADRVEFNFYVSGAQAAHLKESLAGYPVKVISAIPSAQWRQDIRNFHIGMVSLSPGGASVCLPSKTYGMMAGGMAILAVAPEWSDLATLINRMDAGWIVNNSNNYSGDTARDFHSKLAAILDNTALLQQKRFNAFHNVRSFHGTDVLVHKWTQLIEKIK